MAVDLPQKLGKLSPGSPNRMTKLLLPGSEVNVKVVDQSAVESDLLI